MISRPARVALFIWSFSGGGVERMTTRLAGGLLKRGISVDIVVLSEKGPNRRFVPEGASVVPLNRMTRLGGMIWALRRNRQATEPLLRFPLPELFCWLPSFCSYLETSKPDLVVSAMPHCNLVAAAVKAFLPSAPFTILTERNPLSLRLKLQPSHMRRFGRFVPVLYRQADALVGVSRAVSNDLAGFLEIPQEQVITVYNPAFDPEIVQLAKVAPEHPWLAPEALAAHPVILGVGKLHPQKDFPTLIKAFAALRQTPETAGERIRASRLVILGEGSERRDLESLIQSLGISEAVDLPGYAFNPYAYMARASVFVLPSLYEGFGNVLVEALACGCPIVASAAPGGPAEILDEGRFGHLVQPGDAAGITDAMRKMMLNPPDSAELQTRAAMFSVDRSVDSILGLCWSTRPDSSLRMETIPATELSNR